MISGKSHERECEDFKDVSGWSNIDDTESRSDDDSKLMRRVDWRLLPWMCLLYALSLIDRYSTTVSGNTDSRSNIGAARIAGMETELQMSNNNSYSIALLVFFPGYVISCRSKLSIIGIFYSILWAVSLFVELEPQTGLP